MPVFYRYRSRLGLEIRCVISYHPFHAPAPLFAVTLTAGVEQGFHLTDCPNLRSHLPVLLPPAKPYENLIQIAFKMLIILKNMIE